MTDQTKRRPTWVLASLELLNERLESALNRRASYMQTDAPVQISVDEFDIDIANYRRDIAEWKARYGIGEEVTS